MTNRYLLIVKKFITIALFFELLKKVRAAGKKTRNSSTYWQLDWTYCVLYTQRVFKEYFSNKNMW